MPDSPVHLAIAEWQNKQITGTELMRRLVSFDKWMLPVSEAAAAEMVSTGAASRLMYSQDGEGVSRLYLFSDGEAYNAFRASVGQDASEQHFLSTTGTWIFQLPLDPLDFIEIDPATPWQIGYHKEQFPRLRAMAGACLLYTSGQSYVSAVFPLNTDLFPAEIPADFNYDEWFAGYDQYIADSRNALADAPRCV